jgi:hypothetical protein
MASTLNAKMDRLLDVMDREPLGMRFVPSAVRHAVISPEASKLLRILENLKSFIGKTPAIGSVSFTVVAVHACLKEVLLYAEGLRFSGANLDSDSVVLAIAIVTELDKFLALIVESTATPNVLKPIAEALRAPIATYKRDSASSISALAAMINSMGNELGKLTGDDADAVFLRGVGTILSK